MAQEDLEDQAVRLHPGIIVRVKDRRDDVCVYVYACVRACVSSMSESTGLTSGPHGPGEP